MRKGKIVLVADVTHDGREDRVGVAHLQFLADLLLVLDDRLGERLYRDGQRVRVEFERRRDVGHGLRLLLPHARVVELQDHALRALADFGDHSDLDGFVLEHDQLLLEGRLLEADVHQRLVAPKDARVVAHNDLARVVLARLSDRLRPITLHFLRIVEFRHRLIIRCPLNPCYS